MAFFDHFSSTPPTRFGNWLIHQRARTEHSLISTIVPPSPKLRILEIGPGKGHLAAQFVRQAHHSYHVIEPNPTLRSHLKSLGISRTFSQPVPPLPTPPNSYHLVIASDLLEHLPSPQIAEKLLSEIYHTLKPQGHLALLAPDYLAWHHHFFHSDYTHSFPTTPRRVLQLLINTNFTPLNSHYLYGPISHPLGQLISLPLTLTSPLFPGNSLKDRIYKLHLTFLRRFLYLAQKP